MKNQLLSIIVLALLTFTACKQAENSETAEAEVEVTTLDNATFDKRVAALRAFVKAHCDEDIEAQAVLISDTLKWSPPNYRENPWLGKSDFIAALQGYHDNFENITYTEGVVVPDGSPGGFFAGSAYSKEGGSSDPNGIRCYGVWKAMHTESGKNIGVKWFGIAGFNDDNKIAMWTEYWDVNGLAVQIAED